MGSYLEMTHSLLGMTRPSQYVRSRSLQEQSLFSQERNRYLVIYPFTKTVEWYLLNQEERQEQMTAHIRVGHRYPGVRQSLLYSFGIDDQEFVVSYEMDDLSQFQQLVIDLRATEARRHTLNDTPIFTCVHRSLGDALELIS
jgi:chlorite dismutase